MESRPTIAAINQVGSAVESQKKLVFAGAVTLTVLCAAILGLVVAGNELSKDQKVQNGRLVDLNGATLSTGMTLEATTDVMSMTHVTGSVGATDFGMFVQAAEQKNGEFTLSAPFQTVVVGETYTYNGVEATTRNAKIVVSGGVVVAGALLSGGATVYYAYRRMINA